MTMTVALVILFLGLALGFTVVIFVLKNEMTRSRDTSTLAPLLSQALQAPLLDLSDRLNRTLGDLKESNAEKLSQAMLQTQERLERALSQNRSELQNGLQKTTDSLQSRFQSLEGQVSARLENIGKSVESKLNENLKEGFKHFEKVQEHLQAAELKLASLSQVGQSISDLNSLLKLPHLRGSFGEAALERLLADFLPMGTYELQYAITPGSTERVDAVVKLARQVLPIDSKFPREQVLPLFESQDPSQLELARKMLSDFVRSEAKSIAEKYIKPEHGTTDMALLFLPSETLYFEVIRNGKCFEELIRLKVYPVSPNTLAMGLQSIAIAQEYYEMSRGVEKTIEDVKKARKHFGNFEKKFEEIGKGLKKAQEAYETANTHLGRYESSVYRLVGETAMVEEATVAEALPDPQSSLL